MDSPILLLIGIFLLLAKLVRAYYRLASVPGPVLAGFTDIWRFRAQNSPGYSAKLVQLHRKHGKLVRIGPNHISISDPNAVPIVYSTSPVWTKASSYNAASPVSRGRAVPSIIAMSETKHTAVRRSVGSAFTTNSLLEYESSLEKSAELLLKALDENPTADISLWLQLFTMDMLMRIAFTESPEFMQKGGDVDGVIAAVVARFDHWNAWAAMPGADAFNRGRLMSKLKKQGDSPLAKVSLAKLRARTNSQNQPQKKDLLQKFLDGQAKQPDLISQDEVLGMIMSTIGAGADTTASTLTYTFYLLCKHPIVRERLQKELHDTHREGTLSNPPKWNEVYKHPYLEAVLKESMRYFPVAAWGLDRVVPKGGATISNKFIPGGTVVGCQIDAIQRDQEVYGDDALEFRPERWLEASEEQRRRMDRAFIAFSAGKRICMGLHIAWLELKKVVPLILMNYDASILPVALAKSKLISIDGTRRPYPKCG
ncbi:cytochrome P450 [Xylogone sp. PMI_703]|nr:cytochrome P450 [Xylogone sp. PMI_703]